jgi:hypothetical protein
MNNHLLNFLGRKSKTYMDYEGGPLKFENESLLRQKSKLLCRKYLKICEKDTKDHKMFLREIKKVIFEYKKKWS